MKAPSTVTAKKIKGVVAEVERRIVLIRDNGLVDAQFLADSDDPFDRIMRAYCMQHRKGVDELLSRASTYEVNRLLEKVEAGKMLEALYLLFPSFGEVLAPHLVAIVEAPDEERRGLAKVLPSSLWREKYHRRLASCSDLRALYVSCSKDFKGLYQALCDFLVAPITVEYMKLPDEVYQDSRKLRMNIIRGKVCGQSQFWQLLRSGEHDQLIKSVQDQFLRDEWIKWR